MDYKVIHDDIITRAKLRAYDSSKYQNHHIIPRHEDINSTEMVPLTFKEHRIVHKLRWRLYGYLGDIRAYRLMSGKENKDVIELDLSSYAGCLGGRITKDNNLGIFAANTYMRVLWATKNGSKGGIINRDNKLGMFSLSTEQKHINASNAGRIGGAIVGKLFWWTNGVENIRSLSRPENNWYRGMTKKVKPIPPTIEKGVRWWTNGDENKQQKDCPGENWIIGRTIRKNNGQRYYN